MFGNHVGLVEHVRKEEKEKGEKSKDKPSPENPNLSWAIINKFTAERGATITKGKGKGKGKHDRDKSRDRSAGAEKPKFDPKTRPCFFEVAQDGSLGAAEPVGRDEVRERHAPFDHLPDDRFR